MKRKAVFVFMMLMTVTCVFASGTATINPALIPRSAQSQVFTITYMPYAGDSWVNGSLSLEIPEGFYPEPVSAENQSGSVSAVIMRNAAVPEQVSASNIQVYGRRVTISALSLSPNDYVDIKYGYVDTGAGAYGITGPALPGKYQFKLNEAPSGSSYEQLPPGLYVKVTDMTLSKTADVSTVFAGMTITYTIAVNNINTVHTLSEVSLWDTVPEGLAITGTSLLPSVQSGRFIAWAPANLGAVSGNVIALYCQVQPGIRKAGNTLQNTAYAKANDMYNNNYYEEANVSVETQGPVISSVIEAVPATVNQGQHFTVFMTVSNSGNAPAIMVMPGQPLSAAGTGTCSNVSGPNPAYYSSLAEGSSVIFTWVYSANTQGVIYFTGNATAKENGFDISSYVSASNPVSVYVFPTASRTPTMTSTNTPEITLTLTLEATHTVTAGMPYPTGTMTVTEQTATATPTATEILVYPTATCTVTVKIPTPAPSATPLDTVYVDRNYANPGKGEKFTVYFKVPSAGTLEITVYNLSGEKIRQFKKEYTAATSDSVEWDGRNEDGRTAGRGIYFISVRLGKWQEMRKVVVLK